jgi:hypothetical protein
MAMLHAGNDYPGLNNSTEFELAPETKQPHDIRNKNRNWDGRPAGACGRKCCRCSWRFRFSKKLTPKKLAVC